jgi:hypothetical protein
MFGIISRLFVVVVVITLGESYRLKGLSHRSKAVSFATFAILPYYDDEDLDLPHFIQEANKFTVESAKNLLSLVYKDREYARFAALETIARVPYFSYTSVLHLYETLGWFRKKEVISTS